MSEIKKRALCSLQFETTSNYEENLQTLLTLIKQTPQNSIIVAPEVCLSGFDYANIDKVLLFAAYAIDEIKKVSQNKIIILTILEKNESGIFNFAKVFHNGEVIKNQAKAKLFKFGSEDKHMLAGNEKDIEIVEIDGIKIGLLICFELRFKSLWQQLEGADIIAIPAWWGKLRSENFRVLTQALAVINQCYVIASDSSNKDATALSGIITPFGVEQRNGNKPCLEVEYDNKEIKKMRKYLDVGIK